MNEHTCGPKPKLLRAFGCALTLRDWSEVSGLNGFSIRARLRKGSSLEDALIYRGRDFPEGAWEARGTPD